MSQEDRTQETCDSGKFFQCLWLLLAHLNAGELYKEAQSQSCNSELSPSLGPCGNRADRPLPHRAKNYDDLSRVGRRLIS